MDVCQNTGQAVKALGSGNLEPDKGLSMEPNWTGVHAKPTPVPWRAKT